MLPTYARPGRFPLPVPNNLAIHLPSQSLNPCQGLIMGDTDTYKLNKSNAEKQQPRYTPHIVISTCYSKTSPHPIPHYSYFPTVVPS
ncbi:hypothetical protein B0H10DRAFT_2004206 [Mycena sp. CBHHK59/15]|nr:hypothetical protein B0H10DRAFT_2004206 [Mycena sp. CBHHK59/15]